MKVSLINAYLEEAREILGERTDSEVKYDDAVAAHLGRGMDIKSAIEAANQEHPDGALRPETGHWADLKARYDYIVEHEAILKKLGMNA